MPTIYNLDILNKFRLLLYYMQSESIFESSDLEQFRKEISQNFEINVDSQSKLELMIF